MLVPKMIQKMLSVLPIGVFITVLIIASPLGKALGQSVIAVTPVGEFPHALEFNPSNNNIYVANRDSGTVSVIDSTNNTVIGDVNVETSPIALEFNPSNDGVYVDGTLTGTEGLVSVIR
jgi:YVTN family beta-propeller protein